MWPQIFSCLLLVATLAMLLPTSVYGGRIAEYSITPSSQVAYYHYPPPRGPTLSLPQASARSSSVSASSSSSSSSVGSAQAAYSSPQSTASVSRYVAAQLQQHQQQYQQQAAAHAQASQFRPVQRSFSYQPAVTTNAGQQQQQQQQQQHHHQQQQHQQQQQQQHYQRQGHGHGQGQGQTSVAAATTTLKQFTAPTLDNVAFTTALRSQGYGSDAASSPASASASAATISAAPSLSSSSSNSFGSSSIIDGIELRSLNVQLPVPIGITPINISPLPIQAGTPYARLRGVNSYGSLYPQR